jgi:predicted MFS family arabinose efflux permease
VGWFPRALLLNVILAAVTHAVRPIVTYRGLALDVGPAELGLIAASFSILAIVAGLVAGRWINRWTEIPVLLVSLLAMAVLTVSIIGLGVSFATLLAMVALLGGAQTVAAVSLQALIANAGTAEGRDSRFSMQTIAASVGQLLGPAAAASILLIEGAGTTVTVGATDAALAATGALLAVGAAIAVSLVLVPPSEHARDHPVAPAVTTGRFPIERVLRTPTVARAMVVSMIVFAAIDTLVAYLPALAAAHGIGVDGVGLLLACRAGCALLARLALMPLLTRVPRGRLLMAATLLPAAGFALVPISPALPSLFVAMALIGVGLGIGAPLTMSWVAGRSSFELRATALGLLVSGNRVAQVALPAGSAVVASFAGLGAPFLATSAVLALASVVVSTTSFEGPMVAAAEP